MNFRKNEVTLYKNVNLTTKDTIKFKSLQEQETYFNGKIKTTIESNEPLIIDKVRVSDINYLDLMQYTYVSSNQSIGNGLGYKDKTFYYFIEELEYVNEQLTIVHVKLDVYQTYLFNHEIKNSWVVREHQDRFDVNGNRIWNKEKEPITVNNYEYLQSELYAKGNSLSSGVYYVLSTSKPEGSIDTAKLTRYGNLHSYLETSISAFHYDSNSKTMKRVYYERKKSATEVEEVMMASLEVMSKVSYKPELVDVTIVPHLPGFEVYVKNGKTYIKNDSIPIGTQNDVVSWRMYAEDTAGGGSLIAIKNLSIPNDIFRIGANTSINTLARASTGIYKDGIYKEGKIFSPQFMEGTIIEGVDNTVNFYLDEFNMTAMENDVLTFPYIFGNSISKTFSLGIKNYRVPNNIMISKVTDSLILITDEYINSLKFEANSRSAAKLNGVINAVAGLGISAVSGGALAPLALGQMTGIATTAITEKAKLDDLRSRPIKLGTETENVDFNLTSGFTKPRVTLKLPVRSELDRIIGFFKDYGYAANRFGVPNLTGRETFNYVEATDMVVLGSIPNNYKNELKTLFGSGIRLWHKSDDSQFLNFGISNDEVI